MGEKWDEEGKNKKKKKENRFKIFAYKNIKILFIQVGFQVFMNLGSYKIKLVTYL